MSIVNKNHELSKLDKEYNKYLNTESLDNKSKIKQLKQQVRYSKNPMEVKKLNQEIMELQREINKERKVK
jgi:uncharacterized membrane protein